VLRSLLTAIRAKAERTVYVQKRTRLLEQESEIFRPQRRTSLSARRSTPASLQFGRHHLPALRTR